MILDIHTHKKAPYPEGVISLREIVEVPDGNQLYSIGIHPWDTAEVISEETFKKLDEIALNPNIVAIGEAGIDPGKGAPMYRQLQIFRRQVEISESRGKPLIIHSVKSADIILGLKRDLNPKQKWIIHGFRGKPQLASQLTEKGIMLSFGGKFNPDTVAAMPGNMLFAETDESDLSIHEIIHMLGEAAQRDLQDEIRQNVEALFRLPSNFS